MVQTAERARGDLLLRATTKTPLKHTGKSRKEEKGIKTILRPERIENASNNKKTKKKKRKKQKKPKKNHPTPHKTTTQPKKKKPSSRDRTDSRERVRREPGFPFYQNQKGGYETRRIKTQGDGVAQNRKRKSARAPGKERTALRGPWNRWGVTRIWAKSPALWCLQGNPGLAKMWWGEKRKLVQGKILVHGRATRRAEFRQEGKSQSHLSVPGV